MFKRAGMTDVHKKLYDNDRHEILNETDRHDVYKDLLKWMDARA
jgi:alpha-beta hydrolase superfamily lysophospholipase